MRYPVLLYLQSRNIRASTVQHNRLDYFENPLNTFFGKDARKIKVNRERTSKDNRFLQE